MYGTKTYPGLQPIYSQHFLWRAVLSAVVGVILGIVISLIVNCTLLEISLNAFFATYFGLLFVIVGAIILFRIRQQSQEAESRISYPSPADQQDARRRSHLNIFGWLILTSGIICFTLEKDW